LSDIPWLAVARAGPGPVARLSAEKDADDDDDEVDRHGEPVLMPDMLADSPKDHRSPFAGESPATVTGS
jgi:hypothetical protein